MLTVGSLSAMQGSVETSEKKAVITKAVALRSATLFLHSDTTEFMGDVMVSGTGGLNADMNKDTRARSVLIHGAFTQRKGTTSGDLAGVKLDSTTTKTVMGNYVVDSDTVRYVAEPGSKLILHGDFHFAKAGELNATVEFKGDSVQVLMTGAKAELDSILVDNPKGLKLKSSVTQQKTAVLTLRRGRLHSMPMDGMYTWTVQNVQAEQELRGRSTAQEGEKCGADNDEECKATILRGSRQSYVGGPVTRHLLQGVSGAGFASGGYLFPVGMDHKTDQDTLFHYLPLILQLPSDLTETTAATVSPIMDTEKRSLNLTVPTAGGSLTLDAHADLFWKVMLRDKGNPDVKKELDTNANLRLATAGLRNVVDVTGLRIVQWDCGEDDSDDWKNPRLAGRVPAQADASSFGVNGYLNGVVNLTQEGIGLGSCAIFGIAANGRENPIDQADLSGGQQAMVQFINFHAIENRCLHRQLKLSMGTVEGCRLVCEYHGWEHDSNGRVVNIPDLFGRKSAPKLAIRSFPVKIRYGLVWIFPGNPEMAESRQIPDIPELEGPERWACVPISMTCTAHHSMVIDNVSDFSYAYLHRKYRPFQGAELVHFETVGDNVYLGYNTKVGQGKISGLFVEHGRIDTNQMELCYEYPYQWSNTDDEIKHWLFVLPLDERTTRTFFLFYFKVLKIPLLPVRIPRWAMNAVLKVANRQLIGPLLGEDRVAIEAEQKGYD